MALEYARLITKSSTGLPTVAPSSNHDNGDWDANDIYEFELYIDDSTGDLYTQVAGVVYKLSASGSLSSVDHDATLTGDGTPGNPLSVVQRHLAAADQFLEDPVRVIVLNGKAVSDILRIADADEDPAVEFYGNKDVRHFGTVAFDKNIRLNDTFPAFINNGPSSGKQYDFKSEISGFNTFSLVLGVPGGFTEFFTNGDAFKMNKPLRFDSPIPPYIYSNSPAGYLGIDGGNTNNGHVLIFANGAVSFGGNSGIKTVHPSALVDMKTESGEPKGFLPPRMTDAVMNSIPSPAVGLMVYVTDATEGLYVYKSSGWTLIG